jgi:hypothetical protein
MRSLLVLCLVLIFTLKVSAQTPHDENDALLKPTQPGYVEAQQFAKVLKDVGIHVDKIFASKLNGFFTGLDKAAYFQTSTGAFEAIFIPDGGAKKIRVTEKKEGTRYIYSFAGQPHPKTPGDTFDSSEPMFFFAYENAFVVVWKNHELFEELKTALMKGTSDRASALRSSH